MKVLVTGARGFIAQNLIAQLQAQGLYDVQTATRQDDWSTVTEALATTDFVFHLAGVNRPYDDAEFQTGNVDFTAKLCEELAKRECKVPVVFTSSIQAMLDNPYGRSKREAEAVLSQYVETTGARAAIYRLKNVFGKWCQPNYNSVVATFCHNIARDIPITISDPHREIELVYVDDVVQALLTEVNHTEARVVSYPDVPVSYTTSLGDLATTLRSFRSGRSTLFIPDHGDPFVHKLYATYLSYLEPNDFAYDLEQHVDPRGALAEFVKSDGFGQVFVSRTKPGITRGNHYHHTKTEKFLVLEGQAVVRFRSYINGQLIEYPVSGTDFRVIDIPPGYSHSIENVGDSELVTLFWASEIFDPEKPDTYMLPVLEDNEK